MNEHSHLLPLVNADGEGGLSSWEAPTKGRPCRRPGLPHSCPSCLGCRVLGNSENPLQTSLLCPTVTLITVKFFASFSPTLCRPASVETAQGAATLSSQQFGCTCITSRDTFPQNVPSMVSIALHTLGPLFPSLTTHPLFPD